MEILQRYPWIPVYLTSILSAVLWMPLAMYGPQMVRSSLSALFRRCPMLRRLRRRLLRRLLRIPLRPLRRMLSRLSTLLLISALLLILLSSLV